MCLAIPSRVLRIDGMHALVETHGEQRQVNLMLLGEDAIVVGDYVLVQNGCFAYERLEAEVAHQALRLIDEVVTESAGADVRAW